MKEINTGHINQIITTIQGEGNYTGYPVILIRFNGCNLNCPMCDSKYTWAQKKDDLYTFNEIEKQINDQIVKYPNIHNMMITGGEPLQQPELLKFLIDRYSKSFQIQIETNGFNSSNFDFKFFKSKNIQLNISPKLNLKAYPTKITFENIINSIFKTYTQLKIYHISYIFKLVYCKDWEGSILIFYDCIIGDNINHSRFWMMPLTPNYIDKDFNDKYKKSCFETIDFCKKYGFKYSPRIHVDLFKSDRSESTRHINF